MAFLQDTNRIRGEETIMVEANDTFLPDQRERVYRQLSCAKCGEPLPYAQDDTLVCELCGQGHKSLPPPPLTTPTPFSAGDGVAVSWGDRWWSAHVVEMVGTDRYLVHYEGWGPRHDEVVDTSRIRKLEYVPGSTIIPPKIDPRLKVRRGSMASAVGIVMVMLAAAIVLVDWTYNDHIFSRAGSSEVESANFGAITDRLPGISLRADFHVETGQTFYVKWGHGWYLGTVVMVEDQNHIMIQYDGWGDYQNEMVTRDRLRVIP